MPSHLHHSKSREDHDVVELQLERYLDGAWLQTAPYAQKLVLLPHVVTAGATVVPQTLTLIV